jgi:release factor glutamine methyltransferase
LRTVLKHIVARTYRPMLVKYLTKTRRYNYKNIKLEIPPGVFHPGFFSSTQLLLKYIDQLPLEGKTFLELGAGSGLISIHTAKKNALVTASDINPVVIDHLRKNSHRNNVKIEILLSDLFSNIPSKQFDMIAINPPYYKKEPASFADHAWYCGENGEYFFKLFEQLQEYVHENSAVIMVLCDGCDIAMIEKAATTNGFSFRLAQTKQYLLEKNFIYKIGRK